MTVSAESRFKTSKLLTSDATLESVHSAGLETVKSVNLVGLNGINLSLVTQLVGALSYGIVLFALDCCRNASITSNAKINIYRYISMYLHAISMEPIQRPIKCETLQTML